MLKSEVRGLSLVSVYPSVSQSFRYLLVFIDEYSAVVARIYGHLARYRVPVVCVRHVRLTER